MEAIIIALEDINMLKEQAELINKYSDFIDHKILMQNGEYMALPLENLVPSLICSGKALPIKYREYHRQDPYIMVFEKGEKGE